jgi:hypothetical protein
MLDVDVYNWYGERVSGCFGIAKVLSLYRQQRIAIQFIIDVDVYKYYGECVSMRGETMSSRAYKQYKSWTLSKTPTLSVLIHGLVIL